MLFNILLYLSLITIVTFLTNGITTNLFTNNAFAQMQQNQMQQVQSQTNQSSFILKEYPSSLQGSFFKIDNMTFSHHMASVNGIQMHYVIGGHGAPVVLLHGFPQSWYEWRHIMPALAKNYTVIVLISRIWRFFKTR